MYLAVDLVLASYCCVTNYPKFQQLKITNIYYVTQFLWVRSLGMYK